MNNGLPFVKTAHLTCDYEGKPVLVNNCRNCQEVKEEVGRELQRIFEEDLSSFLQQRLAAELAQQQRDEEKKKERTVLHIFDDWSEREVTWKNEDEVVQFFVERLKQVGRVLLVSLYGSRSHLPPDPSDLFRRYNTHVATSDLDLFAIVLFPAKMLSTFAPVEETLKNPEGSKFDFTVHVRLIPLYCPSISISL